MLTVPADRATSKEAAATTAALRRPAQPSIPTRRQALEPNLAAALAAVPQGEAKAKGLALGQEGGGDDPSVAGERRQQRNRELPPAMPNLASGCRRPFRSRSTSGRITPWVMTSGSQFRPPPPPALISETWTRDVNEIREIGGRNSRKRTAEQTTIGRFWFFTGSVPTIRSRARSCARKEMDLVDCARLYALVSMASADAFIAIFDAKYAFNLWRPMTAIRNADLSR